MGRYYLFNETILKLAIIGKILYIIFASKSVKLKGLGLKKLSSCRKEEPSWTMKPLEGAFSVNRRNWVRKG